VHCRPDALAQDRKHCTSLHWRSRFRIHEIDDRFRDILGAPARANTPQAPICREKPGSPEGRPSQTPSVSHSNQGALQVCSPPSAHWRWAARLQRRPVTGPKHLAQQRGTPSAP